VTEEEEGTPNVRLNINAAANDDLYYENRNIPEEEV
jgi:hypothetical protein